MECSETFQLLRSLNTFQYVKAKEKQGIQLFVGGDTERREWAVAGKIKGRVYLLKVGIPLPPEETPIAYSLIKRFEIIMS